MKVLISGAGIGGLTAALCLEKAGHEVLLFERARKLSDAGAGIQCGANALSVMDHLGLTSALEEIAVAPERVDFRDSKTGQTLYSSTWGKSYHNKYGAPYWHLYRADLQACLLSALKSQIYLGSAVERYQESPKDVSVELADGQVFSGDCLIGADGIKSGVRSQLFDSISDSPIARVNNPKPKFTGHVAWRGVVPAERLPNNFMEKIASNFMGQGKHMVIYYLRQQQLLNFVGVVENADFVSSSEGAQPWVENAAWDELKADFAGWHPCVQSLIDAVDKDQCYRWALHDHKPFDRWSSDRVTLLGDAAHATLPYMASGAAMAIEDARVVQRALDQTDSVGQGLQLYQRNRLARTAEIQTMSARLGKLYHLQNSLMLKLAFRALHTIGKRKEDFLPSYNANTVPLL